ncbi:hypothetical protein [Marinobacter sp. UBA3607]|jgi:predicted phage-related endonuclease|uniref:hypothetical protein n=1 Tax=Marinobacter sp. UBA3607 TaxID=1946820 RepID=UPI00257F899C|nr:hypothetical protein [Marinobacter sp. UBA3607]|tara:strand:- start:9950 stop:10252 length:303 start_codon:yes stop_codon:yes gene_type:complete
MKKRFVVALDSSTKEQDEKFKEYIKTNKYGWWHWIDGFWLLVDSSGQLTAKKLRSDLDEFYPRVRRVVLELRDNDDTWSGFGPKKDGKSMFDWLHRNWTS